VLSLVIALSPEILMLDLMIHGMNALEISRQVRRQAPATKVIALSMLGNDAHVAEALQNGASAYVLKQSKSSTLIDAIRAVRAGNRYLSPPLSAERIALWRQAKRELAVDPYDSLSQRQREVFVLLAQGLSSAAIGERLEVSKRTIDTHRETLYSRLGLKGREELVALAVRKGLVGVDPYDALSKREREVFELAAQRSTNAEIGARLNIAERTVAKYRALLGRKLGFKTDAELIRLAERRGLVRVG
jgi:DNA-binding NarL/FixJ family response regulator